MINNEQLEEYANLLLNDISLVDQLPDEYIDILIEYLEKKIIEQQKVIDELKKSE